MRPHWLRTHEPMWAQHAMAGFLPVACYPCHAGDFLKASDRRWPSETWRLRASDASDDRLGRYAGVMRVQRLSAFIHRMMCAVVARTDPQRYAKLAGGARGDCGDCPGSGGENSIIFARNAERRTAGNSTNSAARTAVSGATTLW